MKNPKKIVLSGSPRPMTPQDKEWAELAKKRELESLATIRGLAEKWAASLTGALGVVGLAALIDKSEAFSKLEEPCKTIAQISFIVAIVLAFIATALAVMAAQGTAKRYFIPGGTAVRQYSEEAVEKALEHLRWSRAIAAGAAALVLFAGGLLWFADRAEPSPTVIELPAGSELCAGEAAAESDADYQVRCGPE